MTLWFPGGLPEATLSNLVSAMRRPEGTVNLKATWPGLRDASRPDGYLINLVTGAHIFRLRRVDSGARLIFDHSSPGTGTRAASLDLVELPPLDQLDLWFTWSPEELRFMVVPPPPNPAVAAEGAPAEYDLWADKSGGIVEVGGPGVQVAGATVYVSGAELVSPPARRSWSETRDACSALIDAGDTLTQDYLFKVLASNAALSMLVTGLEVYLTKRAREVEGEGVAPNLEELLKAFGTREERDELASGTIPAVLADSDAFPELLNRVNFQSYDRGKRAWKAAYGIRFGTDLNLKSADLERVQRLLRYRHRVIHVSPMIGMYNQPSVPREEPEFAGVAFARSAVGSFDTFVGALHDATLRLRPFDRATQT